MQRKSSLVFSPRRATAKSCDRREGVAGPRKYRKGEEITTAVLTEDVVREIKRLRRPGVGAKKIIEQLRLEGMSETTVKNVLYGKTWGWVT